MSGPSQGYEEGDFSSPVILTDKSTFTSTMASTYMTEPHEEESSYSSSSQDESISNLEEEK